MVRSAYDAYFAAAATGAAALIGLLFVAVSVRDETIFGPKAAPGGEPLAITAFTGLVNTFVVSLLALVPGTNIGFAAAVMAVISLTGIVRLHRRLHMPRQQAVAFPITLLAYATQLGYGVALLAQPRHPGFVGDLAFITFSTLIISLQRAWALLKGKHLPGPAAAAPGGGGRSAGSGDAA